MSKRCRNKRPRTDDAAQDIISLEEVDVSWADMLLDRLANMETAIEQLRADNLLARIQNAPCLLSGPLIGFASDDLLVDLRTPIPTACMKRTNYLVVLHMRQPEPLFQPHISYLQTSNTAVVTVDRRHKNERLDPMFEDYFRRQLGKANHQKFVSNVVKICQSSLDAAVRSGLRAQVNLIHPSTDDRSNLLSAQAYGFESTVDNFVEYMFSKFVSDSIMERDCVGTSLDITDSVPRFLARNVGLTDLSGLVFKLLNFCSLGIDAVAKVAVHHVCDEASELVGACVSHKADPVLVQKLKQKTIVTDAQRVMFLAAVHRLYKTSPEVLRKGVWQILLSR